METTLDFVRTNFRATESSRLLDIPPVPSVDERDSQLSRKGNGSSNGPKFPSAKIIKRAAIIGLATAALLATGVAGSKWFQFATTHEETDDAYVTGHLHQVSTRVNGTVQEVLVDDNEHVKAGQTLVILDPNDYKVKVDQAIANLKEAQRQATAANSSIKLAQTNTEGQQTAAQGGVANAQAAIAKSQAAVIEAAEDITASNADYAAKQAEQERAKLDYGRYEELEKQRAVTTSARDAARRDYQVAVENVKASRDHVSQAYARLEQAKQQVTATKASLVQAQGQVRVAESGVVQTEVNRNQFSTSLASVERAQAAVEEARLNLSYTRIVAPTTGRIGKKTVEEGQRIEPGQPLMTIVSDDLWVVANFKETQLKRMHAGQKVEMTIDSFSNHKFEGTVLSFSPASGASFAVLPSDNATGNFTKIVQRIPVKVLFTKESAKGYEDMLAPGMSVVTNVDVSK